MASSLSSDALTRSTPFDRAVPPKREFGERVNHQRHHVTDY